MKPYIKSICSAVAIVSALALAPAAAATVDVSAQHSSVFGDKTGANKWYVGVSYTNGKVSRNNVGAGVFRLVAKSDKGVLPVAV